MVSPCSGHPSCKHCNTGKSEGSLLVNLVICSAMTGSSASCSVSNTSSGGASSFAGVTANGNLLKASAFECSSVLLKVMWYS